MKNVVVLLLFGLLMTACGKNKVLTPSESVGKKLMFKHGGGFTGKYNTYYLLDNGQLFKATETEGVNTALKNMPQDKTDQIFTNYGALDIENTEVTTYGNLLYTIVMTDGDKEHTVSWERGDQNTDRLQLYYRSVMNMIKIHGEGQKAGKKSKIKAQF